MAILPQALFALVSGNFMSFTFLSARHTAVNCEGDLIMRLRGCPLLFTDFGKLFHFVHLARSFVGFGQ